MVARKLKAFKLNLLNVVSGGACVPSGSRLGLKRWTNIDTEDRGLMAPDTKTESLEFS